MMVAAIAPVVHGVVPDHQALLVIGVFMLAATTEPDPSWQRLPEVGEPARAGAETACGVLLVVSWKETVAGLPEEAEYAE
jgi:hypothetical protein